MLVRLFPRGGVLLCAAAGIALAARAPGTHAAADAALAPAQVISPGGAPFTDTWDAMRRRDRQADAEIRAGLRPAPRVTGIIQGELPPPSPQRERGPAPPGIFQAPSARLPQTVGAGFNTISLQDQFNLPPGGGAFPPDTNGAIGPNHFMVVINASVAVYSRAGALVSHVKLDSFFTLSSGGVTYPRGGAFDPRVLYDRRTGRWFAVTLERGSPSGRNNHIILAVSRTSDPTGTFDKYLLPVGEPDSGGVSFFTDYETLGVDSNGVYSGMRIFPTSGFSFAKIVLTPLAPLIAATPSLGTVFQVSNITDMFSSPQPAHNHDAVGPTGNAWIFSSSSTAFANLQHRRVTWSGGVPSVSSSSSTLSTPSIAFPVTAPASGSSTNIDSGDLRLQMAMIRNNRLWCCRTIGVNSGGTSSGADRSACEWLEVNVTTSSPSLVQSGRVFDSAAADPRFYYYPSIMVSGQGHAVMGFSGSRGSEFVAAYAAGRLAGDPAGAMGAPIQLKAGEGSYTRNDSIGRNRWGDYSYTSLDPNDDMTLWTVQEWARAPNGNGSIWATRVSELRAPAPTLADPNGSASVGQNGATLSLSGTGFYDPGAGFASRLGVQLSGGAVNGISGISAVFNGPTSVTVTFNVAANASPGPRDVTLTNPDGQTASVPGGLEITSNSSSTLQFQSASFSVGEGGTASIAVTRTGSTASSATVAFATSSGTATSGADFTAASGTLSFGAGETSKTFNVSTSPDRLLEGTESVNLTLSNVTGSGASLGSPSTAVLSITDDTALPAPSGLTAAAAAGPAVQLAWTDGCDNEDGFQVERRVGGGSFSLLTTRGANVTSYTDSSVSVGTAYTYRVRATRGGSSHTGYSNEAAITLTTIQLESAAFAAQESAGTATVTLTRTGGTSGSASARLSTADGTAAAPADYTAFSGSVTFAPGEATRTVTLNILPDRLLEGSETVALSVADAAGAGVLLGTPIAGTLTIADDLARPAPSALAAAAAGPTSIRLTWTDNCDNEDGFEIERRTQGGTFAPLATAAASPFTDTTVTAGTAYTYRVRAYRGGLRSAYSGEATAGAAIVEFAAAAFTGSEASGFAQVEVVRGGDTSGPASVTLSTANGTAAAPADYTALTTTVSFAAGQTSRMVQVSVAFDQLLEGTETVSLSLSDPAGGSVVLGTQSAATLSITDDPARPRPTALAWSAVSSSSAVLSWSDNCLNEDGFRIERRAGAGGAFVPIGTVGANVTLFLDDTPVAGAPYSYRVRAYRAALQSDPSGEAGGTITPFSFSPASASGLEGSTVMVTIVRSGDVSAPASVALVATGGTAAAPEDYAAPDQVVSFAAGQASRSIAVNTAADGRLEGNETILLTIENPSGAGAVIGSPSSGTVTIQDDLARPAPADLAAAVVSAAEIRLTWTDRCNNEAEFVVERKEGGGAFAAIGTAPADAVEFSDTSVTPGPTYTYRVRAALGAVQSGPSGEATAAVPTGGRASISPKKLNFRTVAAGRVRVLTLKVRNTGRGILAGTIGPLGAPFRVLSGEGPFSLGRGATHRVRVEFAPQGPGAHQATLEVTTTDAARPSVGVSAAGKGK